MLATWDDRNGHTLLSLIPFFDAKGKLFIEHWGEEIFKQKRMHQKGLRPSRPGAILPPSRHILKANLWRISQLVRHCPCIYPPATHLCPTARQRFTMNSTHPSSEIKQQLLKHDNRGPIFSHFSLHSLSVGLTTSDEDPKKSSTIQQPSWEHMDVAERLGRKYKRCRLPCVRPEGSME
ncbi:hypothetical protein VTO42DRAFT_6218 [Malbranchea cinnamomea]